MRVTVGKTCDFKTKKNIFQLEKNLVSFFLNCKKKKKKRKNLRMHVEF